MCRFPAVQGEPVMVETVAAAQYFKSTPRDVLRVSEPIVAGAASTEVPRDGTLVGTAGEPPHVQQTAMALAAQGLRRAAVSRDRRPTPPPRPARRGSPILQ